MMWSALLLKRIVFVRFSILSVFIVSYAPFIQAFSFHYIILIFHSETGALLNHSVHVFIIKPEDLNTLMSAVSLTVSRLLFLCCLPERSCACLVERPVSPFTVSLPVCV